MAEPNPLYLKILDACRAQAPEPLYPKPFASAENIERKQLDEALDFLRLHGLVQFTDWVQGMGQGYAITKEGARVLQNPALLSRPLQRPQDPLEAGPEHSHSTWSRGEAIRDCLINPVRPLVTRVLLIANVAVFAMGLVVAAQQQFGSDYFFGRQREPRVGILYVNMGSLRPPLVEAGDWWRLLSYAFVHGGILHIALNMYFLFNVGPLVESLWGSRRFTLLYFISAIAGGLGAYLVGQGAVGASGALCGLLASMIVWLFMSRAHLPRELILSWQSNLMTNVFLLVIISFLPGISWSGHLGGAVGGLLVAFGLHWNRFGAGLTRWAGLLWVALVAGVICGYVVLFPGLQAERTRLDLNTLIPAFNEVGMPLLREGPPQDPEEAKKLAQTSEDAIKVIRKVRRRFVHAESSGDEAVKASAREHLVNLDAWIAFFETAQKALSEPEPWNVRWLELNRRWTEVRLTQQPLERKTARIRTKIETNAGKAKR